jgi:hypothetical protein
MSFRTISKLSFKIWFLVVTAAVTSCRSTNPNQNDSRLSAPKEPVCDPADAYWENLWDDESAFFRGFEDLPDDDDSGEDGLQNKSSNNSTNMVAVPSIRFTQAVVSMVLRDGKQLADVITQLRAGGWNPAEPPLDVVRNDQGELLAIDHRRLIAAIQAGLDRVPVRIRPARSALVREELTRFRLEADLDFAGQKWTRGAFAKTWGEAALFRSANNRTFGYPDFPLNGSTKIPELRNVTCSSQGGA